MNDFAHRPFFSVVVPAFDAAATLPDAIGSVRAQAFGDWELIVVDDGSTDATATVAEEAASADSRVRVIRQENAGCGAARDRGIREARADWIVRFDADDLLLPDFLSRMRQLIEEDPGVEIVSPSGWCESPDGERAKWCPNARYRERRTLSLEDALHGWCPVFTHAAFRRDLWDRVGGIRADAYAEDYDFWVRALASGADARFVPEPLSVYRLGAADQMSARGALLMRSYLETLERLSGSGALAEHDEAAVRKRIRKLQRRVAFREISADILGEERAERLAHSIVVAVRRSRGQEAARSRRS